MRHGVHACNDYLGTAGVCRVSVKRARCALSLKAKTSTVHTVLEVLLCHVHVVVVSLVDFIRPGLLYSLFMFQFRSIMYSKWLSLATPLLTASASIGPEVHAMVAT